MTPAISYAQRDRLKTDRQLFVVILCHVPVAALLVPLGYDTHYFALPAAIGAGLLASLAYAALKGTRGFSVVGGAILMLFSAIMIQAQMGRIEMHFHVFSALAIMMVYRDWLPIVTTATVIAVHHLSTTALQLSNVHLGDLPVMVFDYRCSWSIAFLHAAFVVFEAGILTLFAINLGRERKTAHAMNDLVEQFRQQKDLTFRLEGRDDDQSVSAFNHLMDQFNQLVKKVNRLSDNVKTHANELCELSDQACKVVESQDQDIASAAGSAEEMTQTIHSVADSARQASDAAGTAYGFSQNGREQVLESRALMDRTTAGLEQSAEAVSSLVSGVNSIGGMIASIDDISEQTNLLALNAAIEAARAGDHGRGFAVVASEVRTLSRRTQEFTHNIRETMAQLQQCARVAINAIETGITHSYDTSASISSTTQSLESIESELGRLNSMNTLIASAAEQQACASREISTRVGGASRQNQTILRDAEQVRKTADKLEQSVQDMRLLIEGYNCEA